MWLNCSYCSWIWVFYNQFGFKAIKWTNGWSAVKLMSFNKYEGCVQQHYTLSTLFYSKITLLIDIFAKIIGACIKFTSDCQNECHFILWKSYWESDVNNYLLEGLNLTSHLIFLLCPAAVIPIQVIEQHNKGRDMVNILGNPVWLENAFGDIPLIRLSLKYIYTYRCTLFLLSSLSL